MPRDREQWERLLRDDTCYRTPARGRSGVRACGFMLKRSEQQSYRNRVTRELVVVYVLRGSGTFTDWNGRERRVGAGDLIEMPPGRAHGVVQDGDGQWAEVFVTVDGGFGQVMAELGVVDPEHPVLRPGLDLALVACFEEILGILKRAPDGELPRALLRAHEMLLMAQRLDHQQRQPHPHAALVERACELLGQDVQQRLATAEVAGALGLSYERFRKVFRERMGLSPGEYRIRRRIDHARALLAQRRLSIKEVAYQLGYKDPFTFSKQFKQVVGVSPGRFRRSI